MSSEVTLGLCSVFLYCISIFICIIVLLNVKYFTAFLFLFVFFSYCIATLGFYQLCEI